ncbi:quinoprotein relay system zinc metallohydrolase 1 [Pseudomonas sp. NW5]|uniref:quinoprotein relay system zinc metallohydrolase 1 n=1 Tax=Pseudomonas sp. NW5 TaxID=2934934 RepID=UPI0020207B67|nr:quinoprotein relay system zinc metallohydrolase 1 [Pseudomonas sp. NW5]MCL7462892.1 quinoprotein relay system zinc metallohydrolase 1 [Pseudomonas sp. NW5]
MRLFSLFVALFLSLPLAAAELVYALEPRRIAENTWLLEGSTENFAMSNGGDIVNVAFIVTEAGVVLIDTGISRRYGEALRAAIGRVTERPIVLVINTHHHPDHVFGNQAFSDLPIASLARTRELLAEQGPAFADNLYRLLGDWMRGTEVLLPGETLEPGVREIGGHRLRMLAFSGHTGADLAILDETTGVLFAADLVFYQRALTTPQALGLQVWLDDLAALEKLPYALLVPGHGPVASGREPFAQMRDYLGWLDGLLRDSAAAGLDMNEVMNTPIPERFAAISQSRFELTRTVTHLYPKYEAQVFRQVNSD